MSKNVITCDFMDEAPGHIGTGHAPHEPEADLSRPVHYNDGDIERDGHACYVCGHVVSNGMWHTDPRLDAPRSHFGPVTSDDQNFGG